MYNIPLITLQFGLIAFLGQTHFGYGLSSDQMKAACWNSSVRTEKYPYHATVTVSLKGSDWPIQFGVIISASYVLAATLPSTPTHWISFDLNVYVGSDEKGEGGSKHMANLRRIGPEGELSLFKLKPPIIFGPRAQPIKMTEIGEEVGLNNTILLTALQQQPYQSLNRKVSEANFTLLSEEECKSLLSERRPDDTWQCESSLWTYRPNLNCTVWNKSMLILQGRLVGIEAPNNSVAVNHTDYEKRTIHRYFNIANYRSIIEYLTNI